MNEKLAMEGLVYKGTAKLVHPSRYFTIIAST